MSMYDEIHKFSGDLMKVKLYCKWGLITKDNREVLEPKYDSISYFNDDGFAEIKLDGRTGRINMKGIVCIQPKYDTIDMGYSDILYKVRVNNRWGLIEANYCTEVIPPQYDELLKPYSGLIPVKFNKKWGFIDIDDKEIIRFKYDEIIFDDDFVMGRVGDSYQLINLDLQNCAKISL